jgi:dipeptidyl aminopeptidase/acylaminoacyl peptidase
MTNISSSSRDSIFGLTGLLLLCAPTFPASAQQVDYNKAERFLTWHTERMISGDVVDPNWMEGNNRFWYRNKMGEGYEFILVDPVTGTRVPLFDHVRLAAAMSLAADTAFIAEKLPFESFELLRDETAIEFTAHKKRFECDIRAYNCTVGDTLPDDTPFVESPDEQWEAFVHEHNMYVRPAGGGDSTQLTTDGVEYWSYGLTAPRPNDVKNKRVRRPSIIWSPDSRKMVVARSDERDVEHMHYISMTPQRPVHYSQPYALPGDSLIPYPGFHVLTLEPDASILRVVSNHAVAVEPRPHRMYLNGTPSDSTWSADSDRCYVSYATRGSKSIHLAEIAAATGESHLIVSDSSKTFIDELRAGMYGASWHVTADGNDVIWWSEDDGWAHLYRLDRNGTVKNQITSGPWFVSTLYHVDEARRQIYFTGRGRESGRNIYFAYVYRVNFDGSGLTLITPEDADHTIRWSPSGRFFVDTYSRVETAPVTVVRAVPDGRVVVRAEEADISRLAEIGWNPAEVFTVKARDGVTDLYGLIYFPPSIDSTKKYPIISHIYPGPQIGSVRGYNFKGGGEDFSLAQLGFVVIQLDHLGTPFRSKAFHDNYYGNFTDNGIPDHVTAIKQLAARYPFIDLDRVGIYGHSGGGFASTDAMLRFPEFFKVAVSGAGNHDNRSYNIYWAEKYQGLMEQDTVKNSDNFEASANKTYAENLQGKLLLMHGDMDDNVHPAMTIQVVDELIKANRDFDLIIAPDRAHGLNEPYFIRRRWDYFVRHLLGAEPPKNYEIVRPEN